MPQQPAMHDSSPFDCTLCFEIYAANLAFGRIYKPLLDPLGLTYPQFLVMMTLWSGDGLSVGAIGDQLGLDSSTLTPLIKRLEGAELVTRRRDSRDERRVIVSLTEKGAQLEGQSDQVLASIRDATGLSAREAEKLHDSMRQLRTRLAGAPLA
ncbi:MarR family transcriptional regulator [Paracoccus gahaiensis]|uniref:MarR family transcriptional regulator n=1 Tax=Paracoccus gahaiensis TaxID=1706839 RepID=A0A4U0R6T8_9RHOB|nr:MarR family transcriptional regulator [Paracoccus gahaiensis]TJZ90743.1 MarR family transcriptional regulator [Paracoccus gahaiensis]